MEEKILQFDNSARKYLALAEKKIESESYLDALSYLFCALKQDYNQEILSTIAKTYYEMGLYELSNRYWLKFIDIANEKDYGVAYESMGINFFYLDNYFLAGYYFDKKVEKYGLIKGENLNEEVLEFFTQTFDKEKEFKIAYPFHLADFSEEIKLGKSKIANGDFDGALRTLEKVPQGAKEYFVAQDEISLAEFLNGNVDKAIEICRYLIKENGESVSYYCNLSSFYNFKGDSEKSRYYYDRAISLPEIKEDEHYKLATCSLEQGEHFRAIKHLDIILKEKPYEINLKYLLGLALINAGLCERASHIFRELFTISPDNAVYKFYLQMADSLSEKKTKYQNYLPLIYQDDLPKLEIQKRKKRIKGYLNLQRSSFNKKLSTEELYFDCRWAFCYGDEECEKLLTFLLIASQNGNAYDIIFELLTDNEIRDSIKAGILFTLIVQGYKGKIGVVCGDFFNKFKIPKLGFENDDNYAELFFAYSILMTKLAFLEIDNFDKVAFCTNKVFKKFKNKDELKNFKKEEIACLILYLCNYVRFKKQDDILRLLKVKKAKFEELLSLYNGDKND